MTTNSIDGRPTTPFNDLGRGTTALRPQIDEAVARVLSSGWYVLGPEHDGFEAELAAFLGASHVVGLANGTDALQLALSAVGVTANSTVLTAANAGGYTSTATRAIGAIPVFADVDPASMLLTVDTIDSALSTLAQKPAALVVTHLFGAAAEIQEIVRWAHDHGIPVVEDCAQSLGATVGGRRAGTVADIGATSFYPTKNLGALGDGGAVFTSDEKLAAKVRSLRQYGWESKYRTTVPGGRNSRLDELQAAILRVKLQHLDEWNQRRRDIHSAYESSVGSGARMVNRSSPSFVGHLAVLETDDRERAQAIMAQHGIRTDVHYPIPDHKQPIADGTDISLPVTEAAAAKILSVPLFPELTDSEVETIADALAKV